MKVFISGISGFAASHLIPLLLERGDDVSGGDERVKVKGVKAFPSGKVRLYPLDLRDPENVDRVMEEVRPDALFHLAGVTFLPLAEKNPLMTLDINTKGSLLLALSLFRFREEAAFIFASSGDVYGSGRSGSLPFTEESPLRPGNLYSASKVASEACLNSLAATRNVDIRIARPFNHTGPGQSDLFVCPDFAHQIALMERGARKPLLRTGDLSPLRDFSDVRDIVRGYLLILEKGRKGEVYNLCSGRPVAIEEVVSILRSKSRRDFEIEVDSARLRKGDNPVAYGSYRKAMERLGWRPRIDLNETLTDLLDYWRGEVRSNLRS